MSDTQAASICREIIALERNIKHYTSETRRMNRDKCRRFKELEEWFEITGKPAITIDGRTFRRTSKEKPIERIAGKRRDTIAVQELERMGIRNPENVWRTLNQSLRAPTIEVSEVELCKEPKRKKK